MKKIVVKMRSFKKLFGGDLLQLALLLSLLKVGSQFSYYDEIVEKYLPTAHYYCQ